MSYKSYLATTFFSAMFFMLILSTSMKFCPCCTRLAVPSLAILPCAVITLDVPALDARIAVDILP